MWIFHSSCWVTRVGTVCKMCQNERFGDIWEINSLSGGELDKKIDAFLSKYEAGAAG